MITYVGDQNLAAFAPLLTAEAMEHANGVNTLIYGVIDDGDNLACGAAALTAAPAGAELLSLYVAGDYRRRGYGAALLERLTGHLQKAGIPRLTAVYSPESVDSLTPFLEKAGFSPLEDSKIFEATLGELLKSERFAQPAEPVGGLLALSQIPPGWVYEFNVRQEESDTYLLGPLEPNRLDGDVSFMIVENERLRGGFWASYAEGAYIVEGLYLPREYAASLIPLLHASLQAARAKSPQDTPVRFVSITPAIEGLVTKLFPELTPLSGSLKSMELIIPEP